MELKNNFYFKKILKYCSSNIRSKTEVLKKLRSFENITEEEENQILTFLLNNKFMFEDEVYLSRYLENLSSVKGYSQSKLYLKLSSKISDRKILNKYLKEYFYENEDLEIEKFILKNKHKLQRKDFNEQIRFLLSKGFSLDKVKKSIKNNL